MPRVDPRIQPAHRVAAAAPHDAVPGLWAFGDESFREQPVGTGYYILAAALIRPELCQEARDRMRDLLTRSPKAKLHWKDLDPAQRIRVVAAVADLPAMHVVAVGAPLAPQRQERARRCCLEELLVMLEARGVGVLWLENRPRQLNRKDVDTVDACRAKKQISHIAVRHAFPSEEPALWIADAVAGACSAARTGTGTYLERLSDVVVEVEVRIR